MIWRSRSASVILVIAKTIIRSLGTTPISGKTLSEWKGRHSFGSRPGKPNERKGQNEKFMNFAHFCEFWCFSLGKQARFTLNFCSGMPLGKVHKLTFFWFGLPGPLLILGALREFQGSLGATLGIQKLILGIRNSVLGMASHDLSNTKPTILGATPRAILGIDGDPNQRLSFLPPFSERFVRNWGGPHAWNYFLRELGSYILKDTPKPWQLKAPGPKPTIKQLKEARKGRGTNGPVRGTDPSVKGTEALLIVENGFNCNCFPYGFNCQV